MAVSQLDHRENAQQVLATRASDIAESRIRQVLERVYSFGQTLDALQKTETRHARGEGVVELVGL